VSLAERLVIITNCQRQFRDGLDASRASADNDDDDDER